MKVRRIRIWLSKGWYRVLCSVSLLLLPLLCNTGKAVAATTLAQQQAKEGNKAQQGVRQTQAFHRFGCKNSVFCTTSHKSFSYNA